MPFDGMLRHGRSTNEIRRAFEMLVRLEQFLDDGRKWHRGGLRGGHGGFCLIGAMDHLNCDDLAFRYLVRVARTRHERCPFGQPVLGAMNDHCSDFEELRECLGEAQALATEDLRQSALSPRC